MKTKTELPPNVTEADTKYPDIGKGLDWQTRQSLGLENLYTLTFYKTDKLGWVLTTLHISNASRRQKSAGVSEARTYAIGIKDEKIYTVGRGPHVKAVVEVYLTKDNLDRMQKYIDLWKKGMEDAGNIRDRISSRRAQGQLRRPYIGW